MNTPLENGIAKRFGVLPNFHRLASSDRSMHQSEEDLRELVSAMPAAVFACDREGLITYYNPQAIDIWGCTPDLGDTPWLFLDSRRLYRMDGTVLRVEDSPVKEVLASGAPVVNCELVLERPDRSRINVLANITPLRDSTGATTGAVSIFQDITALKRIQQGRERLLQELERSNRELSQFSYAVSHDLKAPVRHVRALTQLLARRDNGSQADSSHLVTLIEQAADGMERLIESLLSYAQAGHGQLNCQRVSVDAIIESVRVTLAPLIAKTGAQITYTPLPAIEADPVLLEQLLQNLVANAIQYHRAMEPPVVEISGGLSSDGWEFAVKDNGQGIPRDLQDSIFEPLRRLHGAETPGTGLGLALCRTIVARHGGRIWVESAGTGCGATFCFNLAAVQQSPSIPQSQSSRSNSSL